MSNSPINHIKPLTDDNKYSEDELTERKSARSGHRSHHRRASQGHIVSNTQKSSQLPIDKAESNDRYAVISVRGDREIMQDCFIAIPSIECNCLSCSSNSDNDKSHHNTQSTGLFIVCDGHGMDGEKASSKAAKLLVYEWIENYLPQCDANNMQQTLSKLSECFLEVDSKLVDELNPKAGTTVTLAFIHENNLYVANVGDSSAKIYKRGIDSESTDKDHNNTKTNISSIEVTVDHKCDDEGEKKRIEKEGGLILNNNGMRVGGILNMTRALGDSELKPYISPKPSLKCVKLNETDTHKESILVLASDGLWNFVDDSEISSKLNESAQNMEIAANKSNNDKDTEDKAKNLASGLRNLAETNGTTDNLTIAVVMLNKYKTNRI